MTQISFVCTGNTCRSPMAEGIFKKIISDRKIENVSCNSCGIYAFTGDTVSENSVKACRKFGIDISSHRATRINNYIVDEADIIVCMTYAQKLTIKTFAPCSRIIVPDGEISDPYGCDEETYYSCAKQIYSFCEKLADVLEGRIYRMTEGDIFQIAQLEKECFSAPWTEQGLFDELSNDTAHFLVCRNNKNVLGYIGVNEVCDEAYIDNIAVKSDYRRMYVAEELLKKAQSDAFSRGCSFISLEVRKSNASAVALYKKLGYNTVGERKNFYTNPDEDALIMTLYKGDTDENIIS